ncbi:MAG: hypothetical protein V2A71_00630 [Candidatus Eisenbacteria bacterium]
MGFSRASLLSEKPLGGSFLVGSGINGVSRARCTSTRHYELVTAKSVGARVLG